MGKYNVENRSLYFYEGTKVLKNKFNEKNQKKLDIKDTFNTYFILMKLYKNPINGTFDIKYLKEIHKSFFENVYYFAGKFRLEDIIKGDTYFCHWKFIDENLLNLFNKLKKDKYLKNLPKVEFLEKVSYYFTELNIIHPFREGNGRTIREFIRCLVLFNGYKLDWSQVGDEEFIEASIESIENHQNFIKYIEKCIIN